MMYRFELKSTCNIVIIYQATAMVLRLSDTRAFAKPSDI